MRPVLSYAAAREEARIGAAVSDLADELGLSDEERAELLPSRKQTRFANRVHWAKFYLTRAELVKATKRGYFQITEAGKEALKTDEQINMAFLERFEAYREFRESMTKDDAGDEAAARPTQSQSDDDVDDATPDEQLRSAHKLINDALAAELLEKLRDATPAFFEEVIVSLLLAMGYGGADEGAGRTLGQSGDGGVDGVIDQDPLGVDQIYVQAKLYREGNNIGPGAIRDFFGALDIKKAKKGIFVTASTFSRSARETAAALGTRIVLIDGHELARLMIRYGVGCRVINVLEVKQIDEEFFPDP
ncbi:MAG: restriction endonuclease [Alphaproteobacteria bacterium]|nr:restriction endonuclease [Alphaproteobacteria bacterium]